MIFKTFDGKIDKWTPKIGVFRKSFNELGTAVNDAFKSVIDKYELLNSLTKHCNATNSTLSDSFMKTL